MNSAVAIALVRHGLPKRVEGVRKPDPGLTWSGHAQARAVASVLVELPVRVIASSELRRARETAAPTVEKLGAQPIIDANLAEFCSGEDFYIPIEDMIAESDPRLTQWRELMAGGELAGEVAEFRRRATTAVERVAATCPEGMAAIFSHGGVIGACVEKALGDLRLPMAEPHYGSITRIEIEPGGGWKLLTYNELHHIEKIAAGEGEGR